jgi:energy-coupling factor transport system ATP-binding protein
MAGLIRAEGLTHCYSGARSPALNGVDVEIGAGQWVAVVGPNGSGKSTFAKHLNALLLPTSGTVTINGLDTRDEATMWEVRRTVGMVFQNPDNQIVGTIVEEDVAFGPENLGVPSPEIRQRVDDALARVGLTGFSRREPHLLSGGQKQRVAIAGALAMQPRCLVLDEATSMLDPLGRSEVLSLIEQLNREMGLTVIQITHHMDETLLASRILVMQEGRITHDGSPREVFSQEADLRSAGLELPTIVQLARNLRARGLALPPGLLSPDELIAALEEVRAGGH